MPGKDNEHRMRIADFHQDRVNPWIAEILENPEFKYTEARKNQLTPEGLQKVDLIFASLYRRATPETIQAVQSNDSQAIAQLKADYQKIADYYNNTSDFRVIKNPEDLHLQERYASNNVVLHLENGDIITSPEVVDELYKWGVRSVGLMYNHDNQIGGGAGTSSNKDRGLTSLGKKIVGQLMERGMVIDLAHANQKTADDILEQVENYNKTAVTHTALRNPHMSSQINPERLIDKAMLKQIAKKGGVVGFTPTTHFMPSMEAYIDQIKQASDLTGSAKNIAVGSDMGGLNAQDLFKELKEIGQLGIIAEKLSEKANLTDEQIADIMFGNIKRIVDSLNK